ncbi:hypothetical protein SNEBB_000326 [Seison nebaliae]|nr:hypothetical protein SNEBB_000326 [Seison nebaliae]
MIPQNDNQRIYRFIKFIRNYYLHLHSPSTHQSNEMDKNNNNNNNNNNNEEKIMRRREISSLKSVQHLRINRMLIVLYFVNFFLFTALNILLSDVEKLNGTNNNFVELTMVERHLTFLLNNFEKSKLFIVPLFTTFSNVLLSLLFQFYYKMYQRESMGRNSLNSPQNKMKGKRLCRMILNKLSQFYKKHMQSYRMSMDGDKKIHKIFLILRHRSENALTSIKSRLATKHSVDLTLNTDDSLTSLNTRANWQRIKNLMHPINSINRRNQLRRKEKKNYHILLIFLIIFLLMIQFWISLVYWNYSDMNTRTIASNQILERHRRNVITPSNEEGEGKQKFLLQLINFVRNGFRNDVYPIKIGHRYTTIPTTSTSTSTIEKEKSIVVVRNEKMNNSMKLNEELQQFNIVKLLRILSLTTTISIPSLVSTTITTSITDKKLITTLSTMMSRKSNNLNFISKFTSKSTNLPSTFRDTTRTTRTFPTTRKRIITTVEKRLKDNSFLTTIGEWKEMEKNEMEKSTLLNRLAKINFTIRPNVEIVGNGKKRRIKVNKNVPYLHIHFIHLLIEYPICMIFFFYGVGMFYQMKKYLKKHSLPSLTILTVNCLLLLLNTLTLIVISVAAFGQSDNESIDDDDDNEAVHKKFSFNSTWTSGNGENNSKKPSFNVFIALLTISCHYMLDVMNKSFTNLVRQLHSMATNDLFISTIVFLRYFIVTIFFLIPFQILQVKFLLFKYYHRNEKNLFNSSFSQSNQSSQSSQSSQSASVFPSVISSRSSSSKIIDCYSTDNLSVKSFEYSSNKLDNHQISLSHQCMNQITDDNNNNNNNYSFVHNTRSLPQSIDYYKNSDHLKSLTDTNPHSWKRIDSLKPINITNMMTSTTTIQTSTTNTNSLQANSAASSKSSIITPYHQLVSYRMNQEKQMQRQEQIPKLLNTSILGESELDRVLSINELKEKFERIIEKNRNDNLLSKYKSIDIHHPIAHKSSINPGKNLLFRIQPNMTNQFHLTPPTDYECRPNNEKLKINDNSYEWINSKTPINIVNRSTSHVINLKSKGSSFLSQQHYPNNHNPHRQQQQQHQHYSTFTSNQNTKKIQLNNNNNNNNELFLREKSNEEMCERIETAKYPYYTEPDYDIEENNREITSRDLEDEEQQLSVIMKECQTNNNFIFTLRKKKYEEI